MMHASNGVARHLTVSWLAHVQLRKAVSFRNLAEPLDCANWYHLGLDREEVEPGVQQVVSCCRNPGP